MNITFKKIGGLIIGTIGLLLFFMTHQKTKNSNEKIIAQEELVAPAIVDSLNDVTHIYALHRGVIKNIPVKAGDLVKKGQELFSLEDTLAAQHLESATIAVEEAQNSAKIQEQKVAHLQVELRRLKSIDPRAISRLEIQNKKYQLSIETIKLTQKKHQLDAMQSNLKQKKLLLSQLVQFASQDGRILQINGHVHELIQTEKPLILIGDAQKEIVRVSIDERDAARFNPKADAYLTSNEDETLKIPLHFMSSEQYIIHQERLNARVQEVLYYFDRKANSRVIPGQQLDAHILLSANRNELP